MPPPAFESVAVVGVGLIGGSVGLALKARRLARRVVGVAKDERGVAEALGVGAIDEGGTDLASAVRGADLVVVCTPVDRIAADVLASARSAPGHAAYTDSGSTKGNVVRGVGDKVPRFVGAHPIAGAEKAGAAHARADLFDGRPVLLTPTANTDPDALATVERFWQSLGAKTARLDADEHDRILAATSHLPHACAAALAGVTPPGLLKFSAGGFRDCTRIAAGDPGLWAAIFAANRDALLPALDGYLAHLNGLRAALIDHDDAAVLAWLTDAKRVRDALGSGNPAAGA